MNKTAIKNYAIWARTALLQAVKQRAFEYEIKETGQPDSQLTAIAGRLLTDEERKQRGELIEKIRTDGYEQVMEQTAYIWFNRFIALRFMEVNGYLPSRIRVFTNDNGEFRPEILKEAMELELEGLNKEKVFDYLEKQDNEALYKYLLLTQCNALNKSLPYMFEKIDNYTELLFPKGLLKEGSVIGRMISDIPEEDWTDQVQIIGWLYQYYNSELKDDTFTKLKKNIKISKERIPAATQLFTPDWIVRYMVENSLGRLWLEGHPNDSLKAEWKYYLEEAEQEPEVEAQLAEIRKGYQSMKPEDIKIIDPCMGSGHILVAAFDVLMKIYTSCGWSERDAAKSIVENNIYGLDIDDRAGQLAYFSVMMEARKYNRRILNGEVKPNLMAITESGFMTNELIQYVAGEDQELRESLTYLHSVFKDAKEYGSILTVKELNFTAIYERLDAIEAEIPVNLIDQLLQQSVVENLRPLIKQAEILAGKYDVVVTNPPYMGGSGMDAKLSNYVKENYPDSKSDLFAVFIERCFSMLSNKGYASLITMESWMFLSSFEKMRKDIIQKKGIRNMIHMPYLGKGGTSLGINFGTAAFVLNNYNILEYMAQYQCIRYFETDDEGIPLEFPVMNERHKRVRQSNFAKIPGSPVAYWVGEGFLSAYDRKSLTDYATVTNGLFTCDNKKFLRLWHEVNICMFESSCDSKEMCEASMKKWYPYNKGGDFRKWYGNQEYVVNFKKFGKEIKEYRIQSGQSGSFPGQDYYFCESASWSLISSSKFGVRYYPKGFVFDIAGSSVFGKSEDIWYILGFMCSDVAFNYLKITNPTINYQAGDIKRLPFLISNEKKKCAEEKVKELVAFSKKDWDSYETSWDFKNNPLV